MPTALLIDIDGKPQEVQYKYNEVDIFEIEAMTNHPKQTIQLIEDFFTSSRKSKGSFEVYGSYNRELPFNEFDLHCGNANGQIFILQTFNNKVVDIDKDKFLSLYTIEYAIDEDVLAGLTESDLEEDDDSSADSQGNLIGFVVYDNTNDIEEHIYLNTHSYITHTEYYDDSLDE